MRQAREILQRHGHEEQDEKRNGLGKRDVAKNGNRVFHAVDRAGSLVTIRNPQSEIRNCYAFSTLTAVTLYSGVATTLSRWALVTRFRKTSAE